MAALRNRNRVFYSLELQIAHGDETNLWKISIVEKQIIK